MVQIAKIQEVETAYWREYLVAFSATLVMMAAGTAYGWSSPTIPILQGKDSPLPVTQDEGSWIVSLMILGSVIAPLPTAWLVDRVGRKMSLLMCALPFIFGWLLVLVANTPILLYLARLMSGYGYGMVYTVIPMYLGEISSDKIRGSIGILITVMQKGGVLLAYCIGPYVSVVTHASILLLIPATFLLTFCWSPESPYYLLLRQNEEEAQKSLQRLRGREDVKQELHDMAAAVKRDQENKGNFKELLQTKGNRRGLIIVLGLACCQQLCGSQAVIAYSQKIFEDAGGIMDASLCTIVLGVVQLLAATTSSVIVDRCGRRPLLLVSTAGVCISTFIIGLYFFFKDALEWDLTGVDWIPMISILVFILLYIVGLGTVPYALPGEIFPTNVKAVATCAFVLLFSILGFVVTKLYQVVADGLGSYVAFWAFSLFSTMGLIFVFIFIPETKGKSLTQIQDELNCKVPEIA